MKSEKAEENFVMAVVLGTSGTPTVRDRLLAPSHIDENKWVLNPRSSSGLFSAASCGELHHPFSSAEAEREGGLKKIRNQG